MLAGFWSDLGSGIKKTAGAVWSGVSPVGVVKAATAPVTFTVKTAGGVVTKALDVGGNVATTLVGAQAGLLGKALDVGGSVAGTALSAPGSLLASLRPQQQEIDPALLAGQTRRSSSTPLILAAAAAGALLLVGIAKGRKSPKP